MASTGYGSALPRAQQSKEISQGELWEQQNEGYKAGKKYWGSTINDTTT